MFVLKSTHDALMTALREERDRAVARVRALEAAHDAFVREVAERATPKPVPVVTREPDPVAQAIQSRSNGNAGLRTHLAQFAKAERVKGTPDAEIARMVSDWTYRPPRLGEPTPEDRAEADAMMADVLDG